MSSRAKRRICFFAHSKADSSGCALGMTRLWSLGRKRLAQAPEITQVRAYGLDLEQRTRAAKMQGEHSDTAGLQCGEQRPEPVALERRAAPAKLRLPRRVQNHQRPPLVLQGRENGIGVLRQRVRRDSRGEREAAGERIARDQ